MNIQVSLKKGKQEVIVICDNFWETNGHLDLFFSESLVAADGWKPVMAFATDREQDNPKDVEKELKQ